MEDYEDEIKLIDYLNILWKQKWLIFIPTVLIVILVAAYSLTLTKKWAVDMVFIPSKFLIQTESGQFEEVVVVSPQQIVGQISQRTYDQLISDQLNININAFPRLKAENLKDTSLVNVSLHTSNTEQGKNILERLFAHLKKDLDRKIDVEFQSIDTQIESNLNKIKQQELRKKDKLNEIKLRRNEITRINQEIQSADNKLNISKDRVINIMEEMKTVKQRIDELEEFQKITLARENQSAEALSLLLYSNEIQQNFKKDDYIAMKHMVFSIRKIPIFYLPYMRYPLDSEKSTGFLMPRFGVSGPKGAFLSQGFYWDIMRNMDATMNFDYYSAKGLGGGLEYRYLFSQGTGGQLSAYFFRFKPDEEGIKQDDAYIFRLNHNQPLPYGLALIAAVDYQSSFDFLREFDNNFKRAVVSNRASQVYLRRSWSNFNFNARFGSFETYFSFNDLTIIRRSLPEVSFRSPTIPLLPFIYFGFSSGLNNWGVGTAKSFARGTQRKGKDISLDPFVKIPFKSIPWLTLDTTLTGNFDYYFQSYEPGTKRVVDEPILTKNYTVNSTIVGPVFSKVFFGANDVAKVKHIIEPSFTYIYSPILAQSERVVTRYRQLFGAHALTYELTNRLLVKGERGARDLLTLGVGQTYFLDTSLNPLSLYADEDEEINKFSGIESWLRFYPVRNYSIDASTDYDPYLKYFRSIRVGASLGDFTSPLWMRVSWFKSSNPFIDSYFWNRHQIGATTGLNIPALDLQLSAMVEFNIQERELLYSAFSAVYNYQCLNFTADLRTYYFRDKPETQFRISFGLGNIGKTTDFFSGLGKF